MKYTVEGFLQEKLVALGLDMADALILRWFVDFAGTGNMSQLVYNHRIYYFVKYAGIIRDLPVLGISSTKGIGKRFEKYIEKGLLVKTVRRQGAGTLLYFSPTRHLLELQYHSAGGTPLKGTPVPFTESGGDNYIQNELDFSGNEPPCPPDRGEMAGEPPENAHSPAAAETGGCLKGTPVPFVNVKGTPVAFRKEPQFPSERNSSSLALNNSSTRNSSTTDSLTTGASINPCDLQAAAAALKEEFQKRVDIKVFSPDFLPTLARSVLMNGIEARELPDYVAHLFDKASKSRPKSLANYLYRVAGEGYMASEFKSARMTVDTEESGDSDDTTKAWRCFCGTMVRGLSCPECGILRTERNDENALIRARERLRSERLQYESGEQHQPLYLSSPAKIEPG